MAEWKQATGSFWIPEKKDEEITGLLVDIEKEVGDNKSTLYTIQDRESRDNVNIWGSVILDSRMKGIAIGQEVRIVYKGLGDKSPGKHPPKLFEVFYRDPEFPEGE